MKKLILTILFSITAFAQSGTNTVPLSAPPPSGPQQVFVTNAGTTGNVQYCYTVVAVYNVGMSSPSVPACTNSANSTLSGSNYNTVSWNTPPGGTPIGYWVVRSTSTSFPGSGTYAVNSSVLSSSTLTENDQSNTLNSFTFSPAPWAFYTLTLNNTGFGLPVIQWQDQYGNVQNQIYMNQNIDHNVKSAEGNVTVAALHAVPVIVPAVLGATIRVEGILVQAVGGTAATCAGFTFEDTAAVPVVATTTPAATLTSGTITNETSSNVVLTTFLKNLTAGAGLQITDGGSQCTTATSFNYRVFYKVLP